MSAAEDRAENIRLLRESAAAVIPGDYRRIRALRFQDPGFDPATWKEMCDMGWAALRVPEAKGGSGLGVAEYCALAEELGRGLVPEPFIGAVTSAALLSGGALSEVLAGDKVILPAWQERPNSLDTAGDTTVAGGRANGRKAFIPMAAGADGFIVSGRDGLALVARDAAGVSLAIERTQDGGNFGTLTLDNAACTPLSGDMAEALEEAALATGAYLLGVMDRAFAMTLDYMKTRNQFGRAIGSFQALQHRAADLKIQVALTRASVEAAAVTLDTSVHPAIRQSAVSRAKARAAEAAMLVTRQCIQLHGGIGYTDEADIGLFLRKAMVLSHLFGGAGLHRARFAAVAPEDDE
ncbi:MAG: acyl-CoA/acyl-ACP dehydrogenase [Alphaproteobacteria bacterium]|nr:acyl-CoA/acyl-ACP dehydrogenase [Alphaproteobacteria bacterium]